MIAAPFHLATGCLCCRMDLATDPSVPGAQLCRRCRRRRRDIARRQRTAQRRRHLRSDPHPLY